MLPQSVTVEDEPEQDDPPQRPYSPSPELQQQSTERVAKQNFTTSTNEGRTMPVETRPPEVVEVIEISTPVSEEEPEYMTQLPHTNSLIRQATMPILPPIMDDFGIPPSPPGSPDPSLAAKLENFRQLQTRGIHFNDRLSNNKSFRNPKLLDKLRGYVGIDDEYGTNLPPSTWNPHSFTKDQYFDIIAEKQRAAFEALQERQRTEQRSAIEFTAATNKSAAERILEGVNSRPTSRPQSRTGSDSDRHKSRHRDDRRGGDVQKSRDRSPRERDRGYRSSRDGERHRERDRDRGYYRR
jgi:HCNGP-like protein